MRQWKVLIADDEFIIREGIKEAINWEKYDMKVIGEAEDGEEAVHLAIEHHIDLLLVDINMPIKNGIETMKEVRTKLPNCKIVVISGYDDFQFAQEAIKVGVKDYLLKPISIERLEEVIKKISMELEQMEKEKRYVRQLNRHMEKNEGSLRESFIKDWLHNDLDEREIVSQLEFFSFPINVPYSIMLFSVPNHPIGMENSHTTEQLDDYIKNEFHTKDYVIYLDGSEWVVIINWWEANTTELFLRTRHRMDEQFDQKVIGEYIEPDKLSLHRAYSQLKKELMKLSSVSTLAKEAFEYIKTNFTNKHLNLDEIAKHLHVTPVYLSRVIKKEFGISYVQMITNLRIKTAKHYLKTSNLSMKEIAERCGYDSQHYFSTAFRKTVGVSPKNYREEFKKQYQ